MEMAGWSWSYPHKLGYDVAGVVQVLGAGCGRLKVGDEVWGEAGDHKGGAYHQFGPNWKQMTLEGGAWHGSYFRPLP